VGETRQAATLQDRNVFPDGVDLADISPAFEQIAREILQIGQLDGRRRVREQRRRPAGDERQK
jgi:hypothetical protein